MALQQLIADQKYDDLVAACEAQEFANEGEGAGGAATHLLAYLVAQPPATGPANARFLWKRLGPEAKAHAEVTAAWELGKALWKHDFAALYAAARAGDGAWSPLTRPLVDVLLEKQRTRAQALIERAYTTVTVAAAAAALGVGEDEVVERCAKMGWAFDAAKGVLRPVRSDAGAGEATPLDSGLRQLEQLTSYIVHLDTTGNHASAGE